MSDVKIMVTYGCGTNLGNCYSLVSASSYKEGFKIISDVTDGMYAFTYTDEADIARQVKMYGLKKVDLQKQVVC